MDLTPKEILDDINKKIANRQIFKFNRESLIQALIISECKCVKYAFFNPQLCDRIIEQYRTILKFIYMNDNVNGEKPDTLNQLVKDFSYLIEEFMNKYNHIRNYLDQCIIGNREFKYDEEKQVYYEENYDAFSNYARTIDKIKDFSSDDLKEKTTGTISRYLATNKLKSNIFKDRFYLGLIDDYIQMNWLDSEIKFNYDFGDFSYEDIIKFCASLKMICDYYNIITINTESFACIEYDTMVNGVYKYSGLAIEKIKLFLKYQTYDYNYQKDKLTLIQGLLLIDNKFYFYPYSINLGILPIKMYRLLNDLEKEKYEKDFSKIAKKKEVQMTDSILNELDKYNIKTYTNYKIKDGNVDLAEYDLLVFDNKTNNLYICEFKWFFVGDGEREHNQIDKRIEQQIKHRSEKNKYILSNPSKYTKELFDNETVNNVYELLISQNFSGNKDHSMPVIDFETLQWSIKQFDEFKKLMDYLINKEFLNSIPLENKKVLIELEGYKFDINLIMFK